MSLTLPAAYSSASKVGNIQENWIVQLYYDNEGANEWVGISMADTTVGSVFYHGVITNVPSIRSSINLARSTAKTGNVSLNVVNFQYKGDDFSAELLFQGSRKYINRNVKIYSQLNGDSTLANCLQVYQGRLIDISHNDASITLTITEQRPWDFITIPQTKSNNNIYAPVSYGSFTANTGIDFYQNYASSDYYPAPFDSFSINTAYFIAGTNSSTGDAYPALYNKNYDSFIPSPLGGANTTTVGSVEMSTITTNYSTKFYSGATAQAETNLDEEITASNVANMSDKDLTSAATFAFDETISFPAAPAPAVASYTFDFIPSTKDNASLKLKWGLAITECEYASAVTVAVATSAGSWSSGEQDSSVGTTTRTISLTDSIDSATLTITFDVDGDWLDNNQDTTLDATVSIYELYIDETYYDYNSLAQQTEIENVYVGIDGYDNSFSGGSNTADTGLEAHRDLLVRFAGFDAADGDIYNYDAGLDIEASRITSAWNIRWWALEPVELKKILEQLQYEFCFIFKWRHGGGGSYWFVKNSYSSGDVAQTLKQSDIGSIKINNTPFSELLTDMRIDYEKHPHENRYLSNRTAVDATNDPRSDWNIQTKENIKEVKLDMNINKPGNADPGGGNPNDGFADYYMNIFGDIKKIISCDIVNPAVSYDLETGDIIQFSNTAGEMPVEPFGDDWADYYMITNLNRSPGKVSITCREVG